MPRVITGLYKGRRLVSPSGRNTRPTADQVREAMFSILESLPLDFEGARVIDFFAGSGALAFEALSRGAASALLADHDREAAAAVKRNIENMGLEKQAFFLKNRWPKGLSGLTALGPFDLLFFDPPYEEKILPIKLLKDCAELGLAAGGAVAVWEQSPENFEKWAEDDLFPWVLVKTRSWGRQAAAFMRFEGPGK